MSGFGQEAVASLRFYVGWWVVAVSVQLKVWCVVTEELRVLRERVVVGRGRVWRRGEGGAWCVRRWWNEAGSGGDSVRREGLGWES